MNLGCPVFHHPILCLVTQLNLHSACQKTASLCAKFCGKTALNGEIPVKKYQNNIYQSYVMSGGHDVYSTKELKLLSCQLVK